MPPLRMMTLLLLLGPLQASGEETTCALAVDTTRPSPEWLLVSYRQRGEHCEGLYADLNSAPVEVDLISFMPQLKTTTPSRARCQLPITLSWSPPLSEKPTSLVARPTRRSKPYQMDARVVGNTYAWKQSLLSKVGLDLGDIGFVAAQRDKERNLTIHTPVAFDAPCHDSVPGSYTVVLKSNRVLHKPTLRLSRIDASSSEQAVDLKRPTQSADLTFTIPLPAESLKTGPGLYKLQLEASTIKDGVPTTFDSFVLHIPDRTR